MTKQTWTAVVSALCFGACLVIAALAPVPYVVWSPGATTDLLGGGTASAVQLGADTTSYPTTGKLLLTTMNQTEPDGSVSLMEALYAYWAPDREVLPRSAVYPAGATADVVATADAEEMSATQLNATAAALRSAGVEVDPVPVVDSVNATGPSASKLQIHDIVTGVRYTTTETVTAVRTAAEASAAIASGKVGGVIEFTLLRGADVVKVYVTAEGSKSNAELPVAGVGFVQGYRYAPVVSFHLDPKLGGDNAGLLLALATYDEITPDALLNGRVVAGTGSIDANGAVGSVGGVRERIATAERAGASVFVLPEVNCADVGGLNPSVRLVPVATLAQAIEALAALDDPLKEKSVKGCS